MSATLERIEQLLQRLSVENAQLRADNRRLRQMTANRGRGRILDRALDDAAAMLAWRFAGYAISRDGARDLGISERRWEWARALMMAARIHDGADVTEANFAAATERLAAAHDRIAAQGDLETLVLRRRKREPRQATRSATMRAAMATAQASD